jgi:hypothetical protein
MECIKFSRTLSCNPKSIHNSMVNCYAILASLRINWEESLHWLTCSYGLEPWLAAYKHIVMYMKKSVAVISSWVCDSYFYGILVQNGPNHYECAE